MRTESAAQLHYFDFNVQSVFDADGQVQFVVKFTSQDREKRCQVLRRMLDVLEFDAALRASFAQSVPLPKLGRAFARTAGQPSLAASAGAAAAASPKARRREPDALLASPPGSPAPVGIDDAARLSLSSVALEKYLIALNAIPGVATSAALFDFLGIAETMTDADWTQLFADTRALQFAPNTLVLVEEEPNEHLFLVADGAVSIERGGLQLQLLRAGACFGEISAFLGEQNASATVVARLVDRRGKLVEPDRVDPNATAATLRALPRAELTRRLIADAALGRRFAASVTLRLDQLLTALPLARAVGSGGVKAVNEDDFSRRLAFQRMFHLTRHDTILHTYLCSYSRGVRTFHGELLVSERCVAYAAKLFGSELHLKWYFAAVSSVLCDDTLLSIKVDDQVVQFRFAQASDAQAALGNLRRRLTLQRELTRSSDSRRRNGAALTRVNSRGEVADAAAAAAAGSPHPARHMSPLALPSSSSGNSSPSAPGTPTGAGPSVSALLDAAADATGDDSLELDERYWQKLAASATEIKCKSGQVLQRADEPVSFLVQVVRGVVRIEQEQPASLRRSSGVLTTTSSVEPLAPLDIASNAAPAAAAAGGGHEHEANLGVLRDGELFGARAFFSRELDNVRLVAEQAGTVVRRIALSDAWRVFGKRPLLELRFVRALAKGVAQRLQRRELELMAAAQLEPMVPLYYRVAVHRSSDALDDARECFVYRVAPSVTLGHFHKLVQTTAHRDLGLPSGCAIVLLGDTAAKKAAAAPPQAALGDAVYLSLCAVQCVAPNAFEASGAVPGTGGADGGELRTLWLRRVVYTIESAGIDRLNATSDVLSEPAPLVVPERPLSPSSPYKLAIAKSMSARKKKPAGGADDESLSSSSDSSYRSAKTPPHATPRAADERTFSGCVRVLRIETTLLSPIAGAVDMLRRRVHELATELRVHPPRINRLQQLLQGTIMPTVNAGVLSMCESFFDDAYLAAAADTGSDGDGDGDGDDSEFVSASDESDDSAAASAASAPAEAARKASASAKPALLRETKKDVVRERAALCKVLRVFLSQCRACVELSADVISERNLQQFRSLQTALELKYADVAAKLVAQLQRVDGGRSTDATLLWPVRRLTESEAMQKRTELEELLIRRETLRMMIDDIETKHGDQPKPRESLEVIVAVGLELDRLEPQIDAARSTLHSLIGVKPAASADNSSNSNNSNI
jgi:CRP-like cAMP-binding protein